MAATPDADRPRRSTDTIRLHLAPHSDASPDEDLGAISNASRRLRALAVLSGSLTDPLTAEEAADLVEQQALTVLGASSAVVVTLAQHAPNGPAHAREISPAAAPLPARSPDVLTLVHAIGLSADLKATLQRFPLDAPLPLAEVARIGEPIFLESPDELRRYDAWGGALIRAGACAAAAVPVWANRQLRGVLGLTWAAPHLFDEDERAFVISLGVMCAQAKPIRRSRGQPPARALASPSRASWHGFSAATSSSRRASLGAAAPSSRPCHRTSCPHP